MTGAPYVLGSETSREAAERISPLTSSIRIQIFEWIRERGRQGATCDEVEEALGLRHKTASARVCELVKTGALVESGERRKIRSGRTARVLVVPIPGSLRRGLARKPKAATETPEQRAERKARERDPAILDAQQREILAFLRRRGARGATRDEVEAALRVPPGCASARVRELIRKGLAVDSANRRATRSGYSAFVVLATGDRECSEAGGA